MSFGWRKVEVSEGFSLVDVHASTSFRVPTNLESLELSGNSVNLEKSG